MRVSVCLPYWNRGAALRRTLDYLRHSAAPEHLAIVGADVEVSICDDGSDRPGESAAEVVDAWRLAHGDRADHLRVVVTALPVHAEPRCSAAAINAAVAGSSGDYLVLQNPETTHRAPTLLGQLVTVAMGGADHYAVASCWEADLQQWYEHPVHRPKYMHWGVALSRGLWRRGGGVDEGLMAGHCYEDNDLRNALHHAGAKFIACPELVVEHHKSWQEKRVGRPGVLDCWDPDRIAVNRARYLDRWGRYWPDLGGDGE